MTGSIKPKTNFRQAWERLLRASPHLKSRLTDEEISRLSWARKVNTIQALPEAFQPMASELMLEGQDFPYAVLTPTFEGYLKRENEKLVFCLDNRLYVLEKEQQEVTTTSYGFEQIYRIEYGKILLKAWIRICGTDHQGQFSTTVLRFNAITDYLINPFVEAVRCSAEPAVLVDMQQERAKFSPLKWEHYKFMNYARKCLVPGERVEQYILQPEKETDRIKLFGITVLKRTDCLTHILIQTDRELILIRDDETSQILNDESRYGGILNYVPLNHVQEISIGTGNDGLISLRITLPAGDGLQMPFATERRPELEQFIQNIKETQKHPDL